MESQIGKPRTVIVTGAAQGIGWAIARRFLRDGWSVLAVDARETVLPGDLAADAPRFRALAQDITEPGAPEAIVETALERFGTVDVLVNNAGIGNAKPVTETTDAELDRFLAVNFSSAFRVSRAALKVMSAGASIVHVASVLALRATPSTSAYVASKAALAGLTRQMAVEYGPRGIRTNAVAPGLVETALTTERLKTNEGFRRLWAEGTPWPRLGRAEDVAAAVRFLASADAEFINGHVLVVDGGWSAGAPG